MSAPQPGGAAAAPPRPNGNKQQSVNALLSLLRTLGDKNKQPQQQQQRSQQQLPRPPAVQQSPTTAATSTYRAQHQQLPASSSQITYQLNTSSYTGSLHDALQAQLQNSTPRQGYQAPPLPNVQVSTANRQAGPTRVRFAPAPSVAVIPSSSANTATTPAQTAPQANPPLSAAARTTNHVAQTNMQILQNMFKNTNSTASRRRQNALAGLLESIRSGKGISIGKPSQIRPGTASSGSGKQADRNGQPTDPVRKKRRMETPGTGRNRGLYYNLDPSSRQSPAYSTLDEHDGFRSTADEDDEPVGRPFGPWLPSQIGPDGELLPRKRGRQRILTPEEALARRKERNRLAAQESRRRKAQQLSGSVRKVGELGGELEQTKVKYEELTKVHADLVQKYNDLENAHQALKNDYDLLQERQNQITDAIEVASRLGDDDFRNEFSDEDEDDTQQANGDDSSHENGRRAESVLDGDRGDNVISINGVDMNIDEYLAFSLAAAAAAQEGSMEHHVQEDHDQMEDSQQDSVNHDTPGGSQAGVALEGEDYHENGSLANMDHGDDHVYLPLNLPHTTDDLENTSGNTATDPSASIISALEKLNEAHGSASEHLNLEDHPLNMPMDMHESLMETRSEVHHTPEIADPHTTFSSAAISEGQESRKRKRVDEDDELNAAGAEANPATPATIADFDDDEEDDGDFVPETELGGNGDTPGLAEDDAEEAASSPEEDLPAQTQDSTLAQATQGAPQDVEDDEDDEEEDDDDEYFRIEEADYEDLFQPIEDVPIPVDDYQDIQAQYMRHLEEFNATLLREEVAQMIANESAGEISKTAHHPSATTYATVEETEAQRQAYQDTLESLGIAPDASQSAQK